MKKNLLFLLLLLGVTGSNFAAPKGKPIKSKIHETKKSQTKKAAKKNKKRIRN